MCYESSAVADKPNIVFILVDDTGWNALDVRADPSTPGSGSTYYQTPRTSKLALSGIRFSKAYAPSPTCGPSRTSIQYGQTPCTVGKFAEEVPRSLPPAKDTMISRKPGLIPWRATMGDEGDNLGIVHRQCRCRLLMNAWRA